MKLSFAIHQLALAHPKNHLHLMPDDKRYVVDHGHVVRRDGVEFVVLNYHDIPQEDRNKKRYQRLVGIEATICPDSGSLLAIHRNRNPQRNQPYKRHQRRGQSFQFQYA